MKDLRSRAEEYLEKRDAGYTAKYQPSVIAHLAAFAELISEEEVEKATDKILGKALATHDDAIEKALKEQAKKVNWMVSSTIQTFNNNFPKATKATIMHDIKSNVQFAQDEFLAQQTKQK